jgi:hypothetical protein
MSAVMQLTIDGGEVEYMRAASGARLGPNQREIMRKLGFGSLTSTQAGTIVHAMRNERGRTSCTRGGTSRDDRAQSSYKGSGCCRFASTDGSGAMKRLHELGFVEKHAGLWFAKS